MDYTAFLGTDPGAAFFLGLLFGFLVGSCGFYFLETWLNVAPAHRDRTRPHLGTLDDRPLAMRGDVRARIREDVRAWTARAGVPPLRGADAGLDPDARVDDVLDAHDRARRARFVRDLATRDLEIDELTIQKRH